MRVTMDGDVAAHELNNLMTVDDPEYRLLESILNATNRKPKSDLYFPAARQSGAPNRKQVKLKYGSFPQMVEDFLTVYHQARGFKDIPDYFLGCLVARAKVLNWSRLGVIRFISADVDDLKFYSSFMTNFEIRTLCAYENKKDQMALLCYDYHTITTFKELLTKNQVIFRKSLDFMRGYCDSHGSLWVPKGAISSVQYSIRGNKPFLKLVADYFVGLGAKRTAVTTQWRMASKSVYKILPQLYPPGCISKPGRRDKIMDMLNAMLDRRAKHERGPWHSKTWSTNGE